MSGKSARDAPPMSDSAQSSRASSPDARKPAAAARKRRRSRSRSHSRSRSRSPASEPSSSSSESGSDSDSSAGDEFDGEEPAAPRPRRSEPEAAAAAASSANGKSRLRAFEDLLSTPSSSGSNKKKKSSDGKTAHSKTVGFVVDLDSAAPVNSKTIHIGREVEIDGKRYSIIELPRVRFAPCPLKSEGPNADKGSSRFPSSTRIHMFNHHLTIAPYIAGTKRPDKTKRESAVICPDGGVHIVSASMGRNMVNNAVQGPLNYKGWKTYATSLHFIEKRNIGGGVGGIPEFTIVPWSVYQAELDALKKRGKRGKGAEGDGESADGAAAAASSSASAAAAAAAPAKGRRRPTAAGAAAAAAMQAAQVSSLVELVGQMKMAENYLRRPILQYVTAMASENRQSKSVMARTWKKTCIKSLSTLDGVTAANYWNKLTSMECACQLVLFFTPEGGRALDSWIAELSDEETQAFTMQSAIMGSSSSSSAAAAATATKGDDDDGDDGDDGNNSDDEMPSSTKIPTVSTVVGKIVVSDEEEEEEEEGARAVTKKERKEAKRKLKKAKKAEKKEQRRRRKKKAKREESGSDSDSESEEEEQAVKSEPEHSDADAADSDNESQS